MRIVACIALLLIASTSFAEPVFFDAPFEPPAGRVISGWGQFAGEWKGQAAELAAYEKAVAPHLPAMISFAVKLDSPGVSGFLVHYREFAASRGFFVAQVGIDFRGKEHDASIGMRDPQWFVLADGLRDVGRPVLLRIGEEFNDPAARYDSSGYIGAFRHAVDVLRKDHLNFAAVWDASAQGFSDPHYMKWYAGDDVVDWWALELSQPSDFNRVETGSFVDDAARHRKPVVVNADLRAARSEAEALKWYAAFFDFVRGHPAIKAFSLEPGARFARWPKVAAYVKKQLADPRFIGESEASSILRPKSAE